MVERDYPTIFLRRPSPLRHLEARREYWIGEGSRLRLDTKILHAVLEVLDRPPKCFWCQKRPRQGASMCLFCGEVLCSIGCEQAFHHNMHGYNIGTDSGTGAALTTIGPADEPQEATIARKLNLQLPPTPAVGKRQKPQDETSDDE